MRARHTAIAVFWITAALVAVMFGVGKVNSQVPILCFAIALIATWVLRPVIEKGSFTIVGPNEIKNSAGYSVKMTQSELVYREGDRQITFPSSASAAGHAMFKIDRKVPLCWDENAGGPMGKEEQYRIRLRITRAAGFLQFSSTQQRRK